MIHAPLKIPVTVDRECTACAQVRRADADRLPAGWLIIAADANRRRALLCADCAATTKAAILAEIEEQARAIVRGICPVQDDAIFARASVSFADDLGADAVDMVSIMIECEEAFDIEISDATASLIETLADLSQTIFAARYLQTTGAAL